METTQIINICAYLKEKKNSIIKDVHIGYSYPRTHVQCKGVINIIFTKYVITKLFMNCYDTIKWKRKINRFGILLMLKKAEIEILWFCENKCKSIIACRNEKDIKSIQIVF